MVGTVHLKKIFSLVTLLLVVILCGIVTNSASGESQLRADWLWDEDIYHSKLSDEPTNVEPWSYGVDCVGTYTDSGLSWCVQTTPVGKIANNTLIDGPKGTYPFNAFYGFIAPSIPGGSGKILTYSSPPSMGSAQMVQYSTYKPSNLKYVERYGLPTIKEYQYQPDSPISLKYANGQVAPLVARSIAFSNNGQYMAAGLNGGGVMVFNTNNWNNKVISVDTKLTGFDRDKKGVNLAISDDGQFVATNVNLGTGPAPQPALRVYDTRTCLDQAAYLSERTKSNGCEFRDVWRGEFRSLKYPALKDAVQVEFPRQIRFSANNTITFKAIHSRTSPTTFSVSKYSVAADMKETPLFISLLGVGDSYISGEGAFNYRSPTDSRANKCHNSLHAYPYQKGLQHYSLVTSVACSGAKIDDIIYQEDDYEGQDNVNPQMAWLNRTQNQKNMIQRSFLPGYQGQVVFAKNIKPRTTLLSVGGNDINFGNIVTGCVDNVPEKSCYPYYKERRELMEQIRSQHSGLKDLYTKVKNNSQGNVYVVGYPEIAKPGGNCGVNVRLDAEEVKFSSDLVAYLNKVIKNAASDTGVFYVDNQKALHGYRLCEAPKDQAGMNGLTKGNDKFRVVLGSESYHPTAFGYKLLGDSIVTKTNNFTATMPTKTNLGAPAISDSDPLLVGRKPSTINYDRLKWSGATTGTKVVVRGGKYVIDVSKYILNLRARFTVVIQSDPVIVAAGTLDDDGKIIIEIPSTIPAGFHTLHVYVDDNNQEAQDIAEKIYIAKSESDYNGDGVINSEASCDIVPDSGIDDDADGVDDACDTINDPSFAPETQIEQDTADYSEIFAQSSGQSEDNSLLQEYKPIITAPAIPPTSENNNSQTNTKEQSAQPNNVAVIMTPSTKIATDLDGTSEDSASLAGNLVLGESTSGTNIAQAQVGVEAAETNRDKTKENNNIAAYLWLGIVVLAVVVLYRRIRA